MIHQFRTTLPILLILLCACSTKNQKVQIIGQITINHNFDGKYIYFKPLKNFGQGEPDSTLIKDSYFHFSKNADSNEIYILQPSPALRAIIQPMLIVTEPGNIIVKMGIKSSVEGTPLNDSLQIWKNAKLSYLNTYKKLKLQHKKTKDSLVQDSISARIDSLKKESSQFYKNFIKYNQKNIVGEFAKKFSF